MSLLDDNEILDYAKSFLTDEFIDILKNIIK